jgi:hypothetical protein
MMGGVSPETCWAIKKHWNNKFYYTIASCCFFLMRFILRCTNPWALRILACRHMFVCLLLEVNKLKGAIFTNPQWHILFHYHFIWHSSIRHILFAWITSTKAQFLLLKVYICKHSLFYKYWFADVLNFAFNRSIVCTWCLYCVINTSRMISYVTVLLAVRWCY